MVVGVIKIEKTMFDKLKEILLKESWTEQDGGKIYFNGEYRTIFYNKDEIEVKPLSFSFLIYQTYRFGD